MKSFFETLAALGTGAVLLTACGAAKSPANSAEVPSAVEIKPATDQAAPVESETSDSAASASSTTPQSATVPAAPADGAAAAIAAPPAASAKPAARPAAAKKKSAVATKKKDPGGNCGEGTCG